MSQDTRKDPRAKVLTMTVRYKSATLDEFIEHHSYDVSRGGMFIKTPSPFPPGTLLKFEVKIAADQKVIQGVGRVVWKRDSESSSAGDTRPAGMGVKFIKIDDASRKVIDALVESRGDANSAYEAGGGDGGAAAATPPASAAKAPAPAAAAAAAPAAAVEASKPPMARKATMIGLGAINPSSRPSPTSASADKPQASFFPETKSEADMPPPEDRTVMKQAAELLQDALRETGSSVDGASSSKYADPPAKKPVESVPPRTQRSEPPAEPKPAPRAEPKPVSARPAAAAQVSERPVARKPSGTSTAPPGRRVSVPVEAPADKGGGGRIVLIVVAIAAVAAVVFFVNKNNTPPPPPPVPASASAEPAPPPPVASEAPPVPADTASAAPAESAAPPASASAAPPASASASAAPALSVPPKAVAAPVVPAPKPAPVIQAKPAPKPKPVAEPSEPAAPSEPTAAPTPKPVAPAPKPKPAEPAGDNPY